MLRRRLPKVAPVPHGGGYGRLLGDAVFLRYALSQALSLGALLTFVFGAPAVIVGPMGGTLTDFIVVQVAGIAFFILGANAAGRLVARFGAEPTIFGGTALSAAGMLAMLAYALANGADVRIVALLAIPINLGFGFRGPPGFFHAVLASRGDDARGAALTILFILLTAAAGTAAAAPFITGGLASLSAFAAAISAAGVLCLLLLPKLKAQAGSSSAATVSSIQPPPSTREPS